MKKACIIGVSIISVFYVLCGALGYAAFGNRAPGNFLTGFGFYEPYWLVDIANICIVIHLVGAYQVILKEDWPSQLEMIKIWLGLGSTFVNVRDIIAQHCLNLL